MNNNMAEDAENPSLSAIHLSACFIWIKLENKQLWHPYGTLDMATIRKRDNSYQAIVKKKGLPTQRKTFKTKPAALAWGRRIESSMDNGTWVDTSESVSTSIDHIMDELVYSFERFDIPVAGPKLTQLNSIATYFEGISIHDITIDDVLGFAALRRKKICPSTLQQQMYYFRQAIDNSRIKLAENAVEIAIKELVKKKVITASAVRDRRLEEGELEALLDAAQGHWIGPAIEIAVESGMRQGEIHRLKWSDIDQESNIITLMRKDKQSIGGRKKHRIPLFKGVREVLLRSRNSFGQEDSLFSVKRASSISDKFAKLTKKVGIEGLRFHDLRHEAISRMFEKGMRVEQVRLVSGHATLDQLSRYVNLRAENLVDY